MSLKNPGYTSDRVALQPGNRIFQISLDGRATAQTIGQSRLAEYAPAPVSRAVS